METDPADDRRAIGAGERAPSARAAGRGDADLPQVVADAQRSGAAAGGATLRIASYNVHGCIGTDGRLAPERVLAVLRELRADVVGLQEVDSRGAGRTGTDQFAWLAAATGMAAAAGPVLLDGDGGGYGNALLSRLPIVWARPVDLSRPGREPRGAIVASLDLGVGRRLRVVNAHLGLRPAERARQIARLLEIAAEPHADGPTVLLGDLNEWFPFSRSLRRIRRRFAPSPGRATFPAVLPVLALDRIWCSSDAAVVRVAAHRSALARRASDHLPVVADLRLPPP